MSEKTHKTPKTRKTRKTVRTGPGQAERAGGALDPSIFQRALQELASRPSEHTNAEETKQPSPQTIAYKAQMKERRDLERNSRPLSVLAAKEAELENHGRYRSRFGKALPGTPDPNLAVHQISRASGRPGLNSELSRQIHKESLLLYAATAPEDAVDSMLARQLVVLHNATMECAARAAETHSPRARDIELRYALKGAKTFGEIVKLRDSRRAAKQPMISLDVQYDEADVGRSGQPVPPRRPLRSSITQARRNGKTRKYKGAKKSRGR